MSEKCRPSSYTTGIQIHSLKVKYFQISVEVALNQLLNAYCHLADEAVNNVLGVIERKWTLPTFTVSGRKGWGKPQETW
jgi:hypothetical protein